MSSPAIATVIKMMESLSEDVQERENPFHPSSLLNRESAIVKLTLSDRLAQPIAKNTRCCLVVVEKSDSVQKSMTGEITLM